MFTNIYMENLAEFEKLSERAGLVATRGGTYSSPTSRDFEID